jgi:hypothetical protein
MNTFFTKENLLFVISVFSEYMQDTFVLKLEKLEDVNITRKTVFGFMSDVNQETSGRNIGLEQKNIMVLAKTKQHYIKTFQISEKGSKKPNIQNLSRDKDVFGNRQVIMSDKRPEIDPYTRRVEVNDNMERLMLSKYQEDRDEDVGLKRVIPDTRVVAPLDKDTPDPEDEFQKKVRALEDERRTPQAATLEILDTPSQRMQVEKERNMANDLAFHDPKALYQMQGPAFVQNSTDDILNSRNDVLIPRTSQKRIIPKYLSINSFDRKWVTDTLRYKYTVNFQNTNNDLMNKYRNIESIAVSRVIIPEEVYSNNSVINREKTSFVHEFSFSYPYLILTIDELGDVYDGTNQNSRKAFAKLVYHRNYKAPNGRGYIVLKPIQDEKKIFYPSLLSALPKMSISILKPNGELLNKSADSYKLFKVEYESFNAQYLKIVTDFYFDKNEFYEGDLINFTDFLITSTLNPQDARDISDYINRDEGHEIKQMGSPNDSGFFRTFYIEAPGVFDKQCGRYLVTMPQINVLNSFNTTIDWSNYSTTNGFIINSSLQNTLSMKLEVVVDEATILNSQIL